MTKVQLYREGAGGEKLILGHAIERWGVWVFMPAVAGRKPSLRRWPTWQMCLPPWVGYPRRALHHIVE